MVRRHRKRKSPKAQWIAEQTALGNNTRKTQQEYPRITEAYSLYNQCRQQQVVTYQTSKGKETVTVIAQYPTGFSVLPYEGGYYDQPNWLVDVFEAFLLAERKAFAKR
jgi:hypothetical protein